MIIDLLHMSNDTPISTCSHKTIIFAYHTIGVKAIRVLLAKGIDIELVVTHADNPKENIWFESVRTLCIEKELPFLVDPAPPFLLKAVQNIEPDFIFSFYYRHMLPMSLLQIAKKGAYNLHGSLLPKYRGRAPVNWAVLHGETQTGVTLHLMTEKPDAGDILAQTAVPILPDDTAHVVLQKLAVATEQTLWHILPTLTNGTAIRVANLCHEGSYFGARTPEDGRINWQQSASEVYNLYRAVAPPYPGAFTEQNGLRFIIQKAALLKASLPTDLPLGLSVVNNQIVGRCADGHGLHIQTLLLDNKPIDAAQLTSLLARLIHGGS